MNNIFIAQIKKSIPPYDDTNKNFRNFRETENKMGHFSQSSQKKSFLHFITAIFFSFHLAVLKECNAFNSNYVSFIPSAFLQPTNSCFCATERNINLQTILHPSMNYWFQHWDLNQALVKCWGTRSTVDVLTSIIVREKYGKIQTFQIYGLLKYFE